jgi:prepilin-type N-terminal cleavage/methylation domain-containing protein
MNISYRLNMKAFTLVELSIVMLIIGLIIGGITAGSSLIKQASLRAVISELNQFKTAINTFKITYNTLPGDTSNASSFWPTCTSATGDGGNCNGNGDGVIGVSGQLYWNGSTYNSNEELRAWQHLSLSGILTGSYSGFGASSTNQSQPGINSPTSKYQSGVYSFFQDTCYAFSTSSFSVIMLGATSGPVIGGFSIAPIAAYPILSPVDSYNIDAKTDDGNPMTGKTLARSTDGSVNCGFASPATVACGSSASNSYYLQNTGPLCILYYFYN